MKDYTNSRMIEVVNEYIHSERDRNLLIRRYVDGITYEGATSEGFWLCDLSKDEAEWISLDWSNATQWEAQVNKSTMTVEHYEMGNMSLKYTARTNNGNSIVLWVPITGDNRGKVQVITDADGNADIDVKVVVNM